MIHQIAVGVVFRLVYAPDYGILNVLLGQTGPNQPLWLSNPPLAMIATASVDVWQWTPFVYLVLYAGFQTVPGESVEALEEAIQVIRLLWSEQPAVRFAGRHYQLNGVRPGPPPAHPIGIWLGAYKPRMLRLVGRLADGWVPSLGYLSLDEIAAMHATIDAAAEAAGRDPASLRRILNVGDDVTQDQLFTLASVHGFDSFILSTGSRDTLERFGKEMAPALRALIKRERAS